MGKEWRKDDAAYTKVRTDENLMETLRHGNSDFPFQFYDEDLEDFDFGCIDWHWHAEFEFVFVQKGEVHFSVGEDRFHLPEGSGLFINTKVLHRFFAKKEGVIPNFVFGPGLLAPKESLIYRKYVLPVMDFFPDSLAFLPDQPRQERILLEMKEIISLCRLGQSSELRLSSMIQRLWDLLWEEGSSVSRDVKREAHSAASQARLQLMMQYIHAHYEEPVALVCNDEGILLGLPFNRSVENGYGGICSPGKTGLHCEAGSKGEVHRPETAGLGAFCSPGQPWPRLQRGRAERAHKPWRHPTHACCPQTL